MRNLFIIIILSLFSHIGMAQYLKCTFPLDGMVFQRGTDDLADINFAAQYTNPDTTTLAYTINYRIQPLNLSSGINLGSTPPWTSISFNNSVGFFRTVFGDVPNVNKGWYKLEFQVLDQSSIQIETVSVKFGVGDIFVLAGQSNAMGYNYADDANIIPYYSDAAYSDTNLPESVTINPNGVYNNLTNKLATESGTKHSTLSNFEKLKQHNNEIFPYGVDSWAYAVLGKEIQATTQAPITFFNAGAASTEITNWTESIDGGSTYNPYTGQLYFDYAGSPYTAFRNTLQVFGSIMGVRSILWHQGETDANKNAADYTYYQTKMNQLISQVEEDFRDENNNPITNLDWYISKVSWYGADNSTYNGYTNSTLINKQIGLIDNIDKMAGSDTDGIQIKSNPNDPNDFTRAMNGTYSQNVHFSDYGLKMLADSWLAAQPWQGNPIEAKALLPVTVAFTPGSCSSTFDLTAPSGYAKYYWVKKGDILDDYISDQQTITNVDFQTDETLICYVSMSSDANEMNFFACQPIFFGSPNITTPFVPSFANFLSPSDDLGSSEDKQASVAIMASNAIINNGTNVNYFAGNYITMEPGFIANSGTVFKAEVGGVCESAFGLPSEPWYHGNTGSGTGNSYYNGSVLSLSGVGSHTGLTDDLHYYHRTVSEDVSLELKIDAISTGSGNTVGLMIRNTMDSNSGFYEISVDASGSINKVKRKSAGDNSSTVGTTNTAAAGVWLRITKNDNTIKCYFKVDDTSNWVELIGLDDHTDNDFNSSYEVGFLSYGGVNSALSNLSINGASI